MPKTQRLIVVCLALATGVGIGFLFAALFTFEVPEVPPPIVATHTSQAKQKEIHSALKYVLEEKEINVDGFTPYLLLEHFPAVEEGDFNGVEAIVGRYTLIDDGLIYQSGETVGDVAAADISDAGFALFLKNYSSRTGIDVAASSTVEIVAHITHTTGPLEVTGAATGSDEFVACTLDAKMCPDGSYVGRVGPSCEFAACPTDTALQTITCTSEQKQADVCMEIYQPVCATVQIQCLTTPCEPIEKTFGNSCQACSQHSVTEYTEGACSGDEIVE